MNPDDILATLADAREAANYAAFLLHEFELGGDLLAAVERAAALLCAAEAIVPNPRTAGPKVRPAPVAATLYARRVG